MKSRFLSTSWTHSNTYDTRKIFTPLESPAIYGGDNINKASATYRKGGVKAPSFLTGFTTSGILEINNS